MAAPGKVEIIEIGLDDDLKEEIERASQMSEEVQIKLKGQLDGLKEQMTGRKVKEQRKWEGKLDIIFDILKTAYDTNVKPDSLEKYVPKTTIMEAIACEEKDLSPTIQRFKNFLRVAKEDKWALAKKRVRNIASYALVPFS